VITEELVEVLREELLVIQDSCKGSNGILNCEADVGLVVVADL